MVSKIAVIALVAVIAVPILLGYGMNISEVTESTYEYSNDPVNVTPLLQSATTEDTYSFVHADPYMLNSSFYSTGVSRTNPIYESVSTKVTSTPTQQLHYQPGNPFNLRLQFVQYGDIYAAMNSVYDTNTDGLKMTIYDTNNVTILQQNYIKSFYYDPSNQKLVYSYYTSQTSYAAGSYNVTNSAYSLEVLTMGGNNADTYLWLGRTAGTTYADISAGYHFEGLGGGYSKLPAYTRSIVMTVNLDSITDANYTQRLYCAGSYYTLQKTTTGGVVSWTATNSNTSEVIDLYYDPNRSDNTYQIYWDFKTTSQDELRYYYSSHREFRYIGGWPSSIGVANAYLTYTDDDTYSASIGLGEQYLDHAGFFGTTDLKTPTFRLDDAETRGYITNAIRDVTYSPSVFRSNPSTTLSNITMYGKSLQFGGNTYTVTNGSIMLGTHNVSVNGIVMDSLPSPNGGYDNKINGITISNTPQPSTIIFDGSWKTAVVTQSTEASTYQTMKWTAGQFGWDGMDQNFLIVGLITSLGAFIGLGIYARKSRSGGIIPLMIVTGCAAAVFFIML